MIGKEDFVTFEVAKMLHEKGYSGMITCPTLYEAQKWLRNKKTYISALPTRDNGVTCWYYQVVNDNDPDDIMIKITALYDCDFSVSMFDRAMNVKYVHELQNLLTLAGVEMEFKI